jgi:acyl-CoA:acyl-CoA alkyltransferase
MKKVFIRALDVYLPENVISNQEIESMINFNGSRIESGLIAKVFGIKTRRFAGENMQVSDLACLAAEKTLEKNQHPIDFLIFAAASSDLIEPATANIVQSKLGLSCPVMDIKNACNSVVSAIQVASAFIISGIYKNILIVSGEKLSMVINFNPRDTAHLLRCASGYSLGDAGAALIVSEDQGSEIVYQRFGTWGQYWPLCTVSGGGSMAFRNPDNYYFEGKTREMKDVFVEKGVSFINECFIESCWRKDEIDWIITHQVASSIPAVIADALEMPLEKFTNSFCKYGNTASTSIPLALNDALAEGRLKKGDKILVLGLSAGISISVQFIIW